jgi:23S rRNA G2445 N2-methylase RlmL
MSDKLIKEIKNKKPTLQELKIILKKNKITSRNEIYKIMIKHNLLKYVKKDKKFMTMKKRANKNVDNAYTQLSSISFKNVIKSLKQKYKTMRKTIKNRKR